jgi:ADYC domain-containing protein
LTAALLAGALALPAAAAELRSIDVDGTEFRMTLTDGRVLRSAELAGATLTIGASDAMMRLRIDVVERDRETRHAPVWLHSFSTEAEDGSWQPLCDPGPDGRRQGFPLAGRSRSDGAMEPAEPGIFEIVCTSGARGKCVRFGYFPWVSTAMRDIYDACVRMVRADYCGDGEGTTRDGMRIDLYDDRGIQHVESDPAQEFEAGWTAAGAVCVHHVRVRENISLESLAASCPRLSDRLGATCTEERARALGAILFARSLP